MVIFEAPCLQISWHETYGCVEQKWHGFYDGEKFRAGIRRLFDLLAQHKVTAVLTDLTTSLPLSIDDQDWVVNEVIPMLKQRGIKKLAYLIPSDVLTQMGLQRITTVSDAHGLEVKYFDSRDKALEWLK